VYWCSEWDSGYAEYALLEDGTVKLKYYKHDSAIEMAKFMIYTPLGCLVGTVLLILILKAAQDKFK
jgi:hypothetical protein